MVEEITVEDAAERGNDDYAYYDRGARVQVERDDTGDYWLEYHDGGKAIVDAKQYVMAYPNYAEVVRELKAREGDPYFVHALHGEGD